jgi:FtsP/CotA-like multicopper oxidase with cupredoxin domain
MDTHYKVMFDDHEMVVIANDFVPIRNFTTKILSVGIGQRYDVIVNATQEKGDHWFRAIPQNCGGGVEEGFDMRAIMRYSNTSSEDPPARATPEIEFDCKDMPMENLVPVLSIDAGPPSPAVFNHSVEFQQRLKDGLFTWKIKETAYRSPWNNPSRFILLSLAEDRS